MGRSVAADCLKALAEQLTDVASIPSRIARTSSIGLQAGSGISHASTIAGTYGQASPQPIVIAQSACSCISRVSFLGLRPARSRPTSRITSTTGSQIAAAGSVPADSARKSSGCIALKERLGHL